MIEQVHRDSYIPRDEQDFLAENVPIELFPIVCEVLVTLRHYHLRADFLKTTLEGFVVDPDSRAGVELQIKALEYLIKLGYSPAIEEEGMKNFLSDPDFNV